MICFGPQSCLPSSLISIIAAMTTLQTNKDPHLRGVSPNPSKIPVLSQRCQDFSSVKSRSLDQENQDPRTPAQKPPRSTQRQRPLTDTAGLRSKTLHQTEKSPSLKTLRNPLEELKPSSGGSNVGLVTHPQTGTCSRPGGSLLG